MNDLDDLDDMYQFDHKKKAQKSPMPKVPLSQDMPPSSHKMASNKSGLPPMGKAPKHVLDQGLMDDIDHELNDNDYLSSQQKTKGQPDVTTNASPPRHDLLSNNSNFSRKNDLGVARDTRAPPLPQVDSTSFAPSTNEPTLIHDTMSRKKNQLGLDDDDNDLDFLEQEINNVGANSAQKVIQDRTQAN